MVSLWAKFLSADALIPQATWAENLCGPGDYAEAFKNAGVLLADVPSNISKDPKYSLVMMAWGTVGFTTDAVTVVPSNLLLYGGKLHHEHLVNASNQALKRFAAAVAGVERSTEGNR